MRQLSRGNSPVRYRPTSRIAQEAIAPFVRVPSLLQLRLDAGRMTAAHVLSDDRVRAVHGQTQVKWVRTA